MTTRILERPTNDSEAFRNAELVKRWREEDERLASRSEAEILADAFMRQMYRMPEGRMPNILMFIRGGTLDQMQTARARK